MKKLAIAAAAALLAAGCGGGGDDPPQVAGRAEGAYQGNTSDGRQFQALVLEDDQFWSLYGTMTGGTFFVAGLLQGNGGSNNGRFMSTNVRDFGVLPPAAASLSATYVPGSSLSGTLTAAGASASSTFSGTAIPAASFDYSMPASLASITGPWSMRSLDGSTSTLTIAASGGISGSTSGCTFTGTVAPRPSGKNVFNVSLTFGSAPCAQPGQTAAGIAITYLINGGPSRELIFAGVNGPRTSAAVAFGTR